MKPPLDIATVKVAVELTSRCNLRCAMCPMHSLSRPLGDMPWDLVCRVAAELRDNGMRVSWLHEMGEPLLYPRLCEAIELFPGCSLSTNAVALDETIARRLLGTSLRRIRLCLDTVNAEVYPQMRRGGVFERVLGNIRRFLELSRDHDMEVEVQRLIALPTAHETVQDFVELLQLDRYPRARVVEKTCEGLDTSAATELHEEYYGCFQGYPLRWFIVLCDGRVTHCCYDADCQQPIGDLRTQSIRDILASGVIESHLAAFKRKDWEALPRCGECYRCSSSSAIVKDKLAQIGHRLDRVLPVKRVARKLINR